MSFALHNGMSRRSLSSWWMSTPSTPTSSNSQHSPSNKSSTTKAAASFAVPEWFNRECYSSTVTPTHHSRLPPDEGDYNALRKTMLANAWLPHHMRRHAIVWCPLPGGTFLIDDVVHRLAYDLAADLITLDGFDLWRLGQEAYKQDLPGTVASFLPAKFADATSSCSSVPPVSPHSGHLVRPQLVRLGVARDALPSAVATAGSGRV